MDCYVLKTEKGKFAETGDIEMAEYLQKRNGESWIDIVEVSGSNLVPEAPTGNL